jgi:hypothetical protein
LPLAGLASFGARNTLQLAHLLGELLAWLKDHDGLSGHAHLLVGAWVPGDARSPSLQLKHAEVPEFHPPVLQQRLDNQIEDLLDGSLGDDLVNAMVSRNSFGNLFLCQTLPLTLAVSRLASLTLVFDHRLP